MSEFDDYGRDSEVSDILADLIQQQGGSPHSDLIMDLMRTVLKLVEDRTGRGDIKVIRSALKEMRYSFKVFRPYRGRRKVTVFGSARTRPEEASYKQAVAFAKAITDYGFMVITGAGPGIMHAAQEGAGREESFGVNIRLPFEQDANEVIFGDPKLVNFKYFFTRKLIFVKESDAIVLFPGGFGTHDEGFESLTLIQTGKTDPMPLVCLDCPESDYWGEWDRYVKGHLLARGLISEDDLALYKITDSIDEACEEILHFYHVYNSCRWVQGQMVLRLNHRLTDAAVEELNDNFSDIVVSGKIAKSAALPSEGNEPETLRLPRLVFNFNRRQYGRLRQLIDAINASPLESEPREEVQRSTR